MLNIPTDAVHPFPPSGALLVVSPHLDDAALSCAALLDRGEPVDVLTLFSGAPEPARRGWWDERCGFASSAESMPARRREEERALAPDGHRIHLLDLLEQQHFDGPRPAKEADRIAEAVRDRLAEMGEGSVAVPAGAGWAPYWLPTRVAKRLSEPRGPEPHDDHVFTRDALLPADLGAASLILYEELPYLWGGSADRAARGAPRSRSGRSRAQGNAAGRLRDPDRAPLAARGPPRLGGRAPRDRALLAAEPALTLADELFDRGAQLLAETFTCEALRARPDYGWVEVL